MGTQEYEYDYVGNRLVSYSDIDFWLLSLNSCFPFLLNEYPPISSRAARGGKTS